MEPTRVVALLDPCDEPKSRDIRGLISFFRDSDRCKKGRQDTAALRGATIIAIEATEDQLVVYLDGGRSIRAWPSSESGVDWTVETGKAPRPASGVQAPIDQTLEVAFADGSPKASWTWEPSTLLAQRIGRKIAGIAPSAQGLSIDTDDHGELGLSRLVYRDSGGRSFLYFDEE